MCRHLVIGSAGLIGEHLMRASINQGLDIIGTDFTYKDPSLFIDIRLRDSIQTILEKNNPQIIFLPAAIPNVDYCELNPLESYSTNVEGVCNVVTAANIIGAKLVYFSSDYIFDGKSGPYSEVDTPNPINEYGKQKLIAEHYIALHSNNYLIIRTTIVYGWESQGKNFICRLLKTLKNKNILKVPMDQIGNPTYAPNFAEAVIELVTKGIAGVYHMAGPDRINRYNFACEAAKIFGLGTEFIHPILTADLGQPALRPLGVGMKVDKAKAVLSTQLMGYQEGLRSMATSMHHTIVNNCFN
ncbi:dtdp-4-dehydrorhamnose reductase [hydrocarbon metagenome]|uniref:Dtdp-4-dehydrorhamnose reductase n=1 Tax=hydrocarbon metagenome TaxID=938273 RepID=A0A0W8FTF9_9ZZZZ